MDRIKLIHWNVSFNYCSAYAPELYWRGENALWRKLMHPKLKYKAIIMCLESQVHKVLHLMTLLVSGRFRILNIFLWIIRAALGIKMTEF